MDRHRLFCILSVAFTISLAIAQAPPNFNYQGVARNAQGDPLPNTTVGIRFRVHNDFPAHPGSLEYSETHTATTSDQGLFSLSVGGGTLSSGPNTTLATINWATGTHYLEVQMDPAGGSSYVSLGAQLLRSVPYALQATTAAYATTAGTASGISGGILDAADLGLSSSGADQAACAEELGSLTFSTSGAVAMAVAGTRVYLASNSDLLSVVDISDPAAPVLLGSLLLPSSGTPILLGNATATSVMVYKGSGMTTVNTTNAAAMTESASANSNWGTPTTTPKVVALGSTNLVNTGVRLTVQCAPDYPFVPGYLDVAAQGSYVYAIASINFVSTFLVLQPNINCANPSFSVTTLGTLALPGALRIEVRGNRAYAVGNGAWYMIDISDPAAPVLLSTLSMSPVSYTYFGLVGDLMIAPITGAPSAVVEMNRLSTSGFDPNASGTYLVQSTLNTLANFRPFAVAGAYWLTYETTTASTTTFRVHRIACEAVGSVGVSGGVFTQPVQENHWLSAGGNISNSNLGNVGIGTAAPSANLSVNGTANNSSGSWSVFSDARVKRVNGPFTDGLNVIEQLDPVRYTYTADAPFKADGEQIGVIAQELEKAAPYMVSSSEGAGYADLREVDNQAYVFLLINAVQELSAKVVALETENDALKGNDAQLREQLAANTKLLLELKGVLNARSER